MAYSINKDECAGCGVCADTCKTEAITQDEDKYKILEEKCTDCGECASTCPVGCISESN
ncbi:MAG: 4Fe-4S binding protein [Elusimicrobia bacterium]|nr:4Fe-4S binding protein [Candidatus Liberimonas magnetica]